MYYCYQMGKVGSSALIASIPNSIQLHSWSSDLPIKYFSSKYYGSNMGQQAQRIRWYFTYQAARQSLRKTIAAGETPKFIIGVREPVSRNISGFFQALGEKSDLRNVADIETEFYTYCPHAVPISWFNIELKRHFEIDVYNYEFNKDHGYSVISANGMSIFLYRFEDLNKMALPISEFIEQPDFCLKRKNDGSDKKTGTLYRHLKQEFEPAPEYVSWLHSSKYFKHFYA